MFADDILKKQQEVIKRQEEEKERKEIEEKEIEEEENLRVATQFMVEVKTKLSELADQGESLKVSYDETSDLKDCFDALRKLGWEEGISVSHGNLSSKNDEILTFEITDFTVRDSLKKFLFNEKHLDFKEYLYFEKEQEYSIRLSDQESFFDIQQEIFMLKCIDENGKIIRTKALINAAYRNGMEGELPEVLNTTYVLKEIKEIKPTIENFIKPENGDLEKITNYMHILHNRSKKSKNKMLKK